MPEPTPFQQLATVKAITGFTVTLRPHEELIKVSLGDDTVSVLIRTRVVEETQREYRYKRQGQKLISYRRAENTWSCVGQMVAWDDDYPGEIILKYGDITTPEQAAERRERERQCGRPGRGRYPLDSYNRVLDGGIDGKYNAPKMEYYW